MFRNIKSTLPNKKILIIDDDKEYLDLIKKYLQKTTDFEVHTQTDPRQVLNDIDNIFPYFVVLDYDMPYLNGLEVLDHIRRSDLKNIKVIFLSNFNLDPKDVSDSDKVFKKSERNLAAVFSKYLQNEANKFPYKIEVENFITSFESNDNPRFDRD